MPILSRPLFIFLALPLAACGEAPELSESTDPGTRLSVLQELRLGAIDDAQQSLNGFESVVIGPSGELILGDPQSNRIRVFGSDGRPLRTIGAPGSGPGHFEGLQRVSLRGDTILAHDANLKISAFSLDGTYLRLEWGPGEPWMFPQSDAPPAKRVLFMAAVPETLGPDSVSIAMANFAFPGTRTCEPGEHGLIFDVPYLTLDRAGKIADTLHLAEIDARHLIVEGPDGPFLWWPPAAPPRVAFLPQGRGILIAREAESDETKTPIIQLTAIGVRRDTLWRREQSAPRIPYGKAFFEQSVAKSPPVAASWCPGVDAGNAMAPGTAALMDAFRKTGRMPLRVPTISGLHVGQDGSIWLRREEVDADSVVWQLFEGEGEPRGFVRLPVGQTIVAARGAIIVATEQDELDVTYLVRYRLTGL